VTEAMKISEEYRLHLALMVNSFFKTYIVKKLIGYGNSDDSQILTVLENLYAALEELELPCPLGFTDYFAKYSFKCLSHRFVIRFFSVMIEISIPTLFQCLFAVYRSRGLSYRR